MNHLHYREKSIYGLDTETVDGHPYTFQVYGERVHNVTDCGVRTVSDKFLDFLCSNVETGARVFVHNLEFDLPVLFYPYLDAFRNTSFQLKGKFDGKPFQTDILFGKVNHADIRIGYKHWELVDTFAFFKSSLDSLSKLFNLPEKMKKPRKLGEVRYEGSELEYFRRYALRDAEIAYALGKEIVKFHERYDVRPCISAPQLAARIFKHHFFPEGNSCIPANPEDLDREAVLSYHGGKNGMYVSPGIYKAVRVYDINSAYPFAMASVPNFMDCRYDWLGAKRLHKVLGGIPPIPGIYSISGSVNSSAQFARYNPLRDHSFKPIAGDFENIWTTSYELELLLSQRLVNSLSINEAFIVEPTRKSPNPLFDFAHHFYRLKQKEKGPLREFYKIMLNSLYGKFVQNIANVEGDPDMTFDGTTLDAGPTAYQAGGLWNPLLGSLITGYNRAHLTRLEMKHDSIHSSTDSIMTHRCLKTSDKMGDLGLKTSGTAVLLRPKLYIIWNWNREVTAYALHGFHGNLTSFIRLLRSGKRKYFHQRIRKVRESFRQKVRPLRMEKFFKTINLELTGPLPIPPLWIQQGEKRVRV